MARNDRYRPGSVSAHLECNEFCDVEDDDPTYQSHDEGIDPGLAYLGHQCGSWVIGGPTEVRSLIDDLQALLARMEKKENPN